MLVQEAAVRRLDEAELARIKDFEARRVPGHKRTLARRKGVSTRSPDVLAQTRNPAIETGQLDETPHKRMLLIAFWADRPLGECSQAVLG
jgi:hypothetical protein